MCHPLEVQVSFHAEVQFRDPAGMGILSCESAVNQRLHSGEAKERSSPSPSAVETSGL